MGKPTEPLFRLRAVVQRTGLKPDLIRSWEVRHGAISPERSDSNQRLYSENDIERLVLLRNAVESGMGISQIAKLDNGDLKNLSGDGRKVTPSAEKSPNTAVERALIAIRALDETTLRRELEEQIVELGRFEVIDHLLVPLMAAVADGYSDGNLRIVHEHMTSATIRSTLELLRPAFPPDARAPLLFVGTPRGQHHEMAAVLAAAVARIEGWRVTYLGANLPAEEIAAAGRTAKAQAIALSLTVAGDGQLGADLGRLRAALPKTDLIVGGRAVEDYRFALDAAGFISVASMSEFRTLLARLGSTAPPKT